MTSTSTYTVLPATGGGLQIYESRTAALRDFAEIVGADEALVCLLNSTSGAVTLGAAYYYGPRSTNQFVNRRVKIADDISAVTADMLLKAARPLLEACSLTADTLDVDVMFATAGLVNKGRVTPKGLVFRTRSETPVPGVERLLMHLCAIIELSRSERISDAVFASQSKIIDETADLAGALVEVGKVVASSLRASDFSLGSERVTERRYKHFSGDWMEGVDDDPQRVETHSIAGDPLVRVIPTTGDIVVPMQHEALALNNGKFVQAEKFIPQLTPIRAITKVFEFRHKHATDYLQRSFSDTDVRLCDAVFRSIEQYAAARAFAQYYEAVSKFCESTADEDLASPNVLLAFLRTISDGFGAAYLVEPVKGDADLSIEILGNEGAAGLSASYQTLLRDGYLRKFLEQNNRDAPDDVFIASHVVDKQAHISVHFSSYLESTRVLVLTVETQHIETPLLRALIHLVREMHVRFKRQEHRDDRASYITQVRHVLVHHLAGTNRALAGIKPSWDRGIRSRDYWMRMASDETMPQLFDQAVWSLSQARLLLENGRFIIGAISPNSLNKKPIRIVDIVNDTFRLLNFYRDEKNIVVISRITGAAPSIMNGDEELMKIAIMNLVDNAFKYSLHNKKLRWELHYRAKEAEYTFSITSASHPINPAQRKRIFEPFYRGKQKDRLNQRHGTGLGLPVAYQILAAHSKTCVLDTTPSSDDPEIGGGTNTFSFTMPYLTGTEPRS